MDYIENDMSDQAYAGGVPAQRRPVHRAAFRVSIVRSSFAAHVSVRK